MRSVACRSADVLDSQSLEYCNIGRLSSVSGHVRLAVGESSIRSPHQHEIEIHSRAAGFGEDDVAESNYGRKQTS